MILYGRSLYVCICIINVISIRDEWRFECVLHVTILDTFFLIGLDIDTFISFSFQSFTVRVKITWRFEMLSCISSYSWYQFCNSLWNVVWTRHRKAIISHRCCKEEIQFIFKSGKELNLTFLLGIGLLLHVVVKYKCWLLVYDTLQKFISVWLFC